MTKSATQPEEKRRRRKWIRRTHRWLGLWSALFVLLLSVTGIALNHGNEWQLDRRYVSWNWLLDFYGIHAPSPAVSYADRGHRATQLGMRIYFDGLELGRQAQSLTGIAVLGPLTVVTSDSDVFVLTRNGDLVQLIELGQEMSAPIDRLGRMGDRPVVESRGEFLLGDAEVSEFRPWLDPDLAAVTWSVASAAPAEDIEHLQVAYRGRGLTVERVLADLHSGRIVSIGGALLLDIIGVGLILLSVTGLIVWFRRRDRAGRRG